MSFSALQRAEIAEIGLQRDGSSDERRVSVLFNEPKLLKLQSAPAAVAGAGGFSALQRAEIAEIERAVPGHITAVGVSVLFNEPKLLKSA